MTRILFALFASLLALAPAHAQDVAAGKAKAQEICAACHGENGVSVTPAIPNLAGQKQLYLSAQLRAFNTGARKSDIMNPIAAQLSPADIRNLAAYYTEQKGAATGTEVSSMLPNLVNTHVKHPGDYKKTFTMYQTVNYPERPQVRYLYANDAALKAAKEGKPTPNGAVFVVEIHTPKLGADQKPIKGADGNLVPDKLAFVTVMEMQPGWGKDIPEIIRNGDWNYAAFNPDMTRRTAANHAECFACHKPLIKDDYLFSIKPLREFAMKK